MTEANNNTNPTPTTPQGTPSLDIKLPELHSRPKEEPSTDAMFPDFFDGQGNLHDQQVRPELAPQTLPNGTLPKNPDQGTPTPAAPPQPGEPSAAPKPPEEPKPQTPPAEPPKPEYLDLTQISGKFVRVKIDGVEQDVPAESLLKNYQLEGHLRAKLQEVSKREERLLSLQDEMLKRGPGQQPAEGEGQSPEVSDELAKDPKFKTVMDELNKTKAELKEIQKVTAVAAYNKSIEDLDQHVRESFKQDDFKSFVPLIQEEVNSQLKDPKQMTPEEKAKFHNRDYYLNAYSRMKLRGVKPQGAPAAPPAAPAPTHPTPQPAAPGAPRPDVKVVSIEPGGGSPPSVSSSPGTGNVTLQQAYDKAVASGAEEDWQAYISLQMKGAGSSK